MTRPREALIDDEGLDGVPSLPLADQQEARLGKLVEEEREAADQQLVAAMGGEARDGADHRCRREPELLAHVLGPAALGEALDLHDAVDAEERPRDQARGAAAPSISALTATAPSVLR